MTPYIAVAAVGRSLGLGLGLGLAGDFLQHGLFERYFNSKAMRIGGGEAAQALMLDIHSADSAGPSGHSTHASAVGDSGCTRNACS